MKKLAIGLGALVVVVIAAALVLPFVIPTETVKKELLSQVKNATGRDARIAGDFSISILPRVKVVAGKVSFANVTGGKAANMVSIERLNVQVALFPLLSGEVEIDAFVLDKPVINLEVDKAGKPNWQFGQPDRSKPKSAGGGDTGTGGQPGALKLGDVRLVDGTVSYFDGRTGASQKIGDINARVSLPSLASPMRAEGSLVWNKEKVELAFALSNPNAFLTGKKTDIETKISAKPVKLSFRGSATGGKQMKAQGDVDLDVPSIRQLAAWAGAPLKAPGTGYGPLKITGRAEVNGAQYAFRNVKISIDNIRGDGSFSFDGSGKKPLVTGTLAIDKLDLNPYLPPEDAPQKSGGAKPGGAGPAPAKGWSNDPINLSGLQAVNATFDLSVGGILIRKIKIDKSQLGASLRDGVLTTNLRKLSLYGGSGQAKLVADGRQSSPSVTLSFDLSNFQANPFLSDAMGFDRIEGKANAILSVATRGASQRQMISALNGSGKVQFLDGAIRGVNLAAMVRNIKSAFLNPEARATQKTDFAELGGTYVIRQGVLFNNDLLLKSPLLRLTGKGQVDLPKRTVDYRIEPKVVATTKGQGGTETASGLTVPVVVSGPWENVSYRPDLAGVIGGVAKDPAKALESIRKFIPGKSGATDSPSPDSGGKLPIPDPSKALKELFGR